MTALTLYVRSRREPAVLGAALAGAVNAWLLAAASGQKGQVTGVVLALTVLVLVAVLTTTLGGPDDALDRTAARPWGWLRMAHLAAALSGVLVFVAATLLTQTRFGPFTCALRDTAGLLGLTAGAAVVLGAARAWFLPLGWTLGAAAFSGTGPVGEALTWHTQAPGSRPAAVVAAVLSVAGIAAYVSRGPRPRRSSENL